MSEESTGLDGKDEPLWNLRTPTLERRFARQPVEAVVDFDGIKVFDEELQPL